MKILNISIRNVLGARRVELSPSRPITLVAGFNGAAKSSIQECVRMAFGGAPLRVALKRELPMLVTDGAKTGTASVETDAGSAMYALPSGSHTLDGELSLGMPDALPFVLNAQGFARLTPEDRRTFLYSLTDCSVSEERLREMLSEAECDPVCVEEVMPLLKSITGFPAAAKFASDKASEAKGAWRALTGETYGSRKAESWEAPDVKFDRAAIQDAIDACVALEQELEMRTKAAGDRLLHSFALATHEAVSRLAHVDSPHVQASVEILRQPLHAYLEAHGSPEQVLEVDPGENATAISVAAGQHREAIERVAALKADAARAEAASERTVKAASHHRDVLAWLSIAEQLGTDGIPAQLLAQALKPINAALRESAMVTAWRQVTINPDMTITAEGRSYALLCESEQWRVDAMIACALSDLSGIGIVMLDRVDVLDNAGRGELLSWLAGRAERGMINTALLFATLKRPPSGLPESIMSVWLHDGEIVDADTAALMFPEEHSELVTN